MSNTLFPIFLKLENLKVLIVGGGFVAHEKLTALINNSPNANITLVAEEWRNDEIHELAARYGGNIKEILAPYSHRYLSNIDIVICATDNFELHQEIKQECKRRHLLCNVADTPDLCDFYLSSVVQKGDLKIAISSNGKSPTMTKRLREFFEDLIDEGSINQVLENLLKIRNKIKADFETKVDILNKATSTFKVDNNED